MENISSVEDFIYQYEGDQRQLLVFFHGLLTEEFNLMGKMRYKIPFYYGRSWICYLNPLRNDKVELAFTRGNELSNEQGFLDNRGRKQVYGIIFNTIKEVPGQAINEILHEAILLDKSRSYQSKRRLHA